MRSFCFLFVLACSPVTPSPLEGHARQQALDEYTSLLTETITSRWNPRQALRDYPNWTMSAGTLTTVIWVVVDELGDVVATDVAKSAVGFLDREALRAVQSAGPLSPPPSGLLTRSSRGLVAGFPMQFTITVPGEPGSFVQARAMTSGPVPTVLKPMHIKFNL